MKTPAEFLEELKTYLNDRYHNNKSYYALEEGQAYLDILKKLRKASLWRLIFLERKDFKDIRTWKYFIN